MNTTSKAIKLTRHNYSDVIKLELYQNEHTFDIKIESSKGYSDHVYFDNNDKDLIIEQITSDNPHCIWFDDISYHIRFYRTGMRIVHLYGERTIDRTYKFDTSLIVDFIHYPMDKWKVDNLQLLHSFYYLYKDKIIPNIDNEIFVLYRKMIERSKSNDKTAIEFIRMFKDICSWGFCSQRVYLHISFDGYNEKNKDNPSLYWSVSTLEHKRIINGGLIFHHDYKDGEYLESGSYSIHT